MAMRTCTKCGENKPINEFYQRDDPKRNQQSFAVCKSCILKQNNEYRDKNRPHRRKLERESKEKRVWEALCRIAPDGEPKCAVCGFKEDRRLLQLDHIHNDGYKAKTTTKINGAYTRLTAVHLAPKIMRMPIDEVRAKYQILCVAHNWIKRYGEKGEEYALIKV